MHTPVSVVLATALLIPAFACAADLEIEVRGLKSRSGQIHAALFANAEDFRQDLIVRGMVTSTGELSTGIFSEERHMPRKPVDVASAPAKGRTVVLKMIDLDPGIYALALYHDVNDDAKLDTTINGVPLEPWGLSNNPSIVKRDATWEDAKFELPAEGLRLVIDLQQ